MKLENQRIVCLKGYNADPLYDCLMEMYRAQENEQFLKYLQGSRSSGTSSSDRARTTYTIPDYDVGVSCSDNVRDYVLKKKFPGKVFPRSTSSKTSLISGSQSSLEGTNVKDPQEGMPSGYASEKLNKIKDDARNVTFGFSQKVPMLQKALRELKGSQYNDDKYRKAALRQIDEYMRSSFNMDFVNLFDPSALHSLDANEDDDEDASTLGGSHQVLKQYENLPYKQHFPPLTAYSDESGDEKTTEEPKTPQKKIQSVSDMPVPPSARRSSLRRNSDEAGETRSSSRELQSSLLSEPLQRRHSIGNPQKKKTKQRFIKVYQPGQSRPIFISGANTLGGLPEPTQTSEKRLSDRLKHVSPRNISQKQRETKPASNSCPLINEAGEKESRLAAGYDQATSLSETHLHRRRFKWDDSERAYASFQEKLRIIAAAKAAAAANESQYETSIAMEKSLQEANDLVRTLFDNLSIGAPAPVITVASSNCQENPGFSSAVQSTISSTLNTTTTTVSQYSHPHEQNSTSESDSMPSASSHSDERKTV